jgi:phage FluMu protein Com
MAKLKDSPTLSKRKVSHRGALKKGKQFEREIANKLGHIFPEAERVLEYQASKVIGVDIEGTDRIKIQCKNHQNYCSIGTINEIKIKSSDDIPVLVTKGNRLEAMAVLPFEKLVTLLEIAYGLELPFRTFDNPSIKMIESNSSYIEVDCPKECNALDQLI